MASGRVPVDLGDVDRWCIRHLGSAVSDVRFRTGNLSTVLGLRLASARTAVVKVRPPAARLAACAKVHHHLFAAGFPCPRPLVGLEPLGPWMASAEEMLPAGDPLPACGRSPVPHARALAHLLALAPDPTGVPTLDPPMPWTAPGPQAHLWPRPDYSDVDLNVVDGPSWIDETGAAARARLASQRGPMLVGHGDWYTENVRWRGNTLVAVWDWDSVISAPEPVLVGLAAAVYPAVHPGTEATVEETQGFLDAYGAARSRPFSPDEIELAWAAGLWNRSFDAKWQYATEGAPRSLTEREAAERRERMGPS